MPTPTDEKLYESIKKDLFKKYKEEHVKKHKNYNYYSGSRHNSNLKRWFDEKWQNQRG